MIDTKEIAKLWRYESVVIRRPPVRDASDIIIKLCCEIDRLNGEISLNKKRVESVNQQNDAMLLELQNVIQKHRHLS